jgi:hypothetical protein
VPSARTLRSFSCSNGLVRQVDTAALRRCCWSMLAVESRHDALEATPAGVFRKAVGEWESA